MEINRKVDRRYRSSEYEYDITPEIFHDIGLNLHRLQYLEYSKSCYRTKHLSIRKKLLKMITSYFQSRMKVKG